MQGSRIALLATAVALSGTVVLESLQRQRDVDVMAAAAADFLASLSSEQREQATFGFDSELVRMVSPAPPLTVRTERLPPSISAEAAA